MGNCYYSGEGVEQDYEKAFEFYERAAGWSEPHAVYALGVLYWNGEGVEQVGAKAMELFHEAAALGEEHAVQALADLSE